jgi:hypothetical protein
VGALFGRREPQPGNISRREGEEKEGVEALQAQREGPLIESAARILPERGPPLGADLAALPQELLYERLVGDVLLSDPRSVRDFCESAPVRRRVVCSLPVYPERVPPLARKGRVESATLQETAQELINLGRDEARDLEESRETLLALLALIGERAVYSGRGRPLQEALRIYRTRLAIRENAGFGAASGYVPVLPQYLSSDARELWGTLAFVLGYPRMPYASNVMTRAEIERSIGEQEGAGLFFVLPEEYPSGFAPLCVDDLSTRWASFHETSLSSPFGGRTSGEVFPPSYYAGLHLSDLIEGLGRRIVGLFPEAETSWPEGTTVSPYDADEAHLRRIPGIAFAASIDTRNPVDADGTWVYPVVLWVTVCPDVNPIFD